MGSGLRVGRVEAGGAVRRPVHQGGDLSGDINASDHQKDDGGGGTGGGQVRLSQCRWREEDRFEACFGGRDRENFSLIRIIATKQQRGIQQLLKIPAGPWAMSSTKIL